MAGTKTNQGGIDNAHLRSLVKKAGLTEQEVAKAAGLHINTVKKILRNDHVHDNSKLKLERALTQIARSYQPLSAHSASSVPLYAPGSDNSINARKIAVLALADELAKVTNELVLELNKSGGSLDHDEVVRIARCLDLARQTLALAPTVAKDP